MVLDFTLRALARRKTGLSHWLQRQASVYLNYYNDFDYDPASNGELLVLRRLATRNFTTVFDVGSNVGDWSRLAAECMPSAMVHAFELSERTRLRLKQTLQGPNFVVADVALADSEGTVQYKDYGDSSTVNTLVATTYHDGRLPFDLRSARVTTGDAYMAAHGITHVDFVKIDVEGAEYQVLKGFARAIADHRITVIQFEYGYANGDNKHLMKDFYDLLTASKYGIGRIWSAGVRFSPFKYEMNNFDSGPNYLAVAAEENALIDLLRSPA